MKAAIGRLLQIAGMILLPVGLSIGAFGGDVKMEVRLLFIGIGLFFAGWLLSPKKS